MELETEFVCLGCGNVTIKRAFETALSLNVPSQAPPKTPTSGGGDGADAGGRVPKIFGNQGMGPQRSVSLQVRRGAG